VPATEEPTEAPTATPTVSATPDPVQPTVGAPATGTDDATATAETTEVATPGVVVDRLDKRVSAIPGSVAEVRYQVTNTGPSAARITLEVAVSGPEPVWATSLWTEGGSEMPDGPITLAGGESIVVVVHVAIPADAYQHDSRSIGLHATIIED
jgi:hypothetical protein